jgi:hypothetical protein
MQQISAVGVADSVRQWRAEAEHVCMVDKRDIDALDYNRRQSAAW